ncbi:protein kinase [Planctomycetota bacterium]
MNDNRAATLEEALNHFIDGHLRGRQPDIDEFIKQYPQCEIQLKKRIQDLREIDTLFDSIFQADQSDFDYAAVGNDLVGRKVGNFEIVEIIGRGGMGVVYLAHDTKLKRSVAVKSMPVEMQANSTSRTRFIREAELLASLNHPNIAVIHEIIEEEKFDYLILEYVPGDTLAERIAREPLSIDEALSIARQITEAISAAHEKSIIHRDLKPGNIKITPEGRVKVLDFGLAKAPATQGKKAEITETHPGRVIGTPAYMSPEQARGKETDHRTDIWSFGCIMYQILTGQLPFEGETVTDTLAGIVKRQPDFDLLPDSTPANIRALLAQCLEKDPDKRLGDITNATLEISETLTASAMAVPTKSRKVAMIFGAALIIILSAIAARFIPQQQAQLSPKEIRLLVLQFENLGSVEDEYFATGLTDEITTRLAGIHGLRVYKSREEGAKKIAKELGVDYILEGTLQRAQRSDPNSPVRIRPKLIRASDDSLVWAQPYDDVREVLQIQSEVAEQVAQALDITLLEPQRQALRSEPTENKEAYVYYLRGNVYSSRLYQNKNDVVIAIELYERAIELDDKFALAHAKLSHAYSGMYKFRHDRSEERRAMAWEESHRALELDPELPEAHWARGVYYYWCCSDYVRALEELEIARKNQPRNSRILATIGYVQRIQGEFEQALANIKSASELNPLSNALTMELGNTFRHVSKYAEADRCYDRAIFLSPESDYPYFLKATLYLVWKGSTEEARVVLERASQYINLAEVSRFVNLWFRLDLLDRNYQGALARLPLKSPTSDDLRFPNALRYAEIYGYMKDKQSAEKYYEKAMRILESKLREDPNNAWYHSALGVAHAGLGNKEDAIREGELAVEMFPYTKDFRKGFAREKDLAYIYTMVGKSDKAIDQLERLLSIDGEISIPLLQLNPAWDPLRNHPRFKKLVEPYK